MFPFSEIEKITAGRSSLFFCFLVVFSSERVEKVGNNTEKQRACLFMFYYLRAAFGEENFSAVVNHLPLFLFPVPCPVL